MRESFSKNLVELVKERPNTYVLSGDHGYALFDALRIERLGLAIYFLVATSLAWPGYAWFQKTRKGLADVL